MTLNFLARNLLGLLFKRELRFEFDRIPLRARNISGLKLLNLFRIGLNRLLPLSPALGFPYMAHVSPAGLCNLRCAICPVHAPETRGKALLPLPTFKKLVDQLGEYLIYIILWSWGEPFLNPDIYEMIEYARQRNILTVNGNQLQPQPVRTRGSEATHRSGARCLNHRPGWINGRELPQVPEWRKRPTSHWEHATSCGGEGEAGKEETFYQPEDGCFQGERARGRGVPFSGQAAGSRYGELQGLLDSTTRVRRPAIDRQYAPQKKFFRWYDYQPDFIVDRKASKYRCKFPWTKPTLFADGEVLACEFDFRYSHSFGNLNEKSFREIWFGEKAKEFRRRFRKNRDNIAFCRDCVFDYKLIPGCVVEWEILR